LKTFGDSICSKEYLEEAMAVQKTSEPSSEDLFAVSSQLLEILSRAGTSIRNPELEPPTARADKNSRYLEGRIFPDPQETSEAECVRRISLDELSREKWELLKGELDRLQLNGAVENGLLSELEKIGDEQIRRLVYMILTYCNPRQRMLVLFMYREAARRRTGSRVYFKVNDLLEVFGYKAQTDGSFPSRIRSQLHRDLMALHRTEINYARPVQRGKRKKTQLEFRSIVRIRSAELDNMPRDFDLAQAADDGYGCADAYTVELEFFDDESGVVLFNDSVNFEQKDFGRTNEDYETKLLVFLASKLKKDTLLEGDSLVLSKRALFKNLDLFGNNGSRNNQILWRTITNLQEQGYIVSAGEVPGKRTPTSMTIKINLGMMRPG
jgi:hypothetical protein